MSPQEIQSASGFVAFMETIWEGKCFEGVDGGVLVVGNNQYDEYYNARDLVRRLPGFKKLWGNRVADKPGYIYQAPDGSRDGVATDGSACYRAESMGFALPPIERTRAVLMEAA